jgi:hypothetical protein
VRIRSHPRNQPAATPTHPHFIQWPSALGTATQPPPAQGEPGLHASTLTRFAGPARLSSVGSNRAPCGITLRGSASAERRIRADSATTARTRTVEGSPGFRRQQDSVPIPAPVPKGAAQRLITSRWCRDGRRGGHSFGRCRAVDAARARYAGVGPIALHRPAGPLPAEAEPSGGSPGLAPCSTSISTASRCV